MTDSDRPILQPYDLVRATFAPKRIDDLKPEAAWWVGKTASWRVAWLITPEDGGPYVGQWAMTLSRESDAETGPHNAVGWVPSGDLEDVELLRRIVDG